jgi:hypothetical protein
VKSVRKLDHDHGAASRSAHKSPHNCPR